MQLIITEKCHNLHLYQVHYFCYFFPAIFPNSPCSFYLLSVLSVSNAQGLKPKITNAALGKLTSVSWLFPGAKKTDCPVTSLMHSVTFSFCQMQKNIKMWLSIIKKKKMKLFCRPVGVYSFPVDFISHSFFSYSMMSQQQDKSPKCPVGT